MGKKTDGGVGSSADLELKAAALLKKAGRIKQFEKAEAGFIPAIRAWAEKDFEGVSAEDVMRKIKTAYAGIKK